MGKLLGAGMTGAVHVATHNTTGKTYAVKSINIHKLDPAQLGELRNEVALLRRLDHPAIVRLYEVYETKRRIFLVMQYLTGDDLSKGAKRLGTETKVRAVIRNICRAIAYCHAKQIIHRDIKLENFVFTQKGNYEDISVIDFGISKRWTIDHNGQVFAFHTFARTHLVSLSYPYLIFTNLFT